MKGLENFLSRTLSPNVGKLMLRLSLGVLMLFHGWHKVQVGIVWIKKLVLKMGLPEFIAYGVYLGEVVAPIFIILGLFTRINSAIYAINMAFVIYAFHLGNIFAINNYGGLKAELPLIFLFGALALMFMGPGKISFDKK